MSEGPEQGSGSRLIGILDGTGPSATVDFYDKLVQHTPATQDQEHLRVIIRADPTVPSRQDALLSGGADPTPWLLEGMRRLVDAGAEIIVVPCNTVHAYLATANQPVEFISIIDVTLDAIRSRKVGRVGLLTTDGALSSGLFQTALHDAGIDWIVPRPARQRQLMTLVETVKAGRIESTDYVQLVNIIDDLRNQGAEAAVAACTEIPTLLNGMPLHAGGEVVDPPGIGLEDNRTRKNGSTVTRTPKAMVSFCQTPKEQI